MNWPVVELASAADVIRGVTFSKGDTFGSPATGLVPVLRAGNISNQLNTSDDLVFVKGSFVADLQRLRRGDIVVCMSSGSANVLGKSAMLEGEWQGSFGAFLAVVRAQPEKICPEFLSHYLRTPKFRLWASSSSGIGIKNIRVSDLKAYQIPLPPLPEQKRIAGILDQAVRLCRLRARAIETLNTLGQAIFQEMFGDPRTNPKSWPVKRLTALGELERGVSKHRPRNDPALLDGEHPLIQTGDVSRARDYITSYSSSYSDAGLKQSRKWPKGTLCITIAANIADTAILDFDACFPDSVVGFNSGNAAMNFFIHRWFETAKGHLEDIAPAVAQKNINLAILRDLPVITPPQGLIENFFRYEQALRQQATVSARSASLFDSLFTALQHRAFRGEL